VLGFHRSRQLVPKKTGGLSMNNQNQSQKKFLELQNEINCQLTLILQLQKLAREEIKNGSMEMAKAILLKAEQIIQETSNTQRNMVGLAL
jgi:hypothetical protein